MDVARLLGYSLFAFGVVALTGCAEQKQETTNDKLIEKTDPACTSAAIPNSFVVRWKDGHTSVIKAKNKEEFIRKHLKPNEKDIDFAEHDFEIKLSEPTIAGELGTMTAPTPEEIGWGQKWISAASAWELANGTGVTVAVVDTGSDITHAQLKNQLSINPHEIPSNGIDDDGNGIIDDYNGVDFTTTPSSGLVVDTEGHGTHVAGIILAEHTSGGIQGVAPGAKLLPLKFLSADSDGVGPAINAINYAVSRKAKVINASWGGDLCSLILKSTIQSLEDKGVLFVAAAGNGDRDTGIGYNLDFKKMFPAAFPLSGQIVVGAIGENGVMTGFSNFSRTLVHVMAPGHYIWSTYKGGGYARLDGTSMAAPFVSGAAAVLWSYRPKATVAQIKAAIIAGVDPGHYTVSSGGSLNLRRSLDEIAKVVDP